MQKKRTLVIGASDDPQRYAYRAVTKLDQGGFEPIALGIRDGMIGEHKILTGLPDLDEIHTVSLYVSAKHQSSYADYLTSLQPQRVIFNPGTENPELLKTLRAEGIDAFNACTLVMISTDQF